MRDVIVTAILILYSFSPHAQQGFIYVSDAGNWSNPPWQIMKYDANGDNPEIFISDSMAWPQDILFIEDSNFVLISNLNSGKINRHNATTGDFASTFASGIGGPTRLELGPDGNLYVLQWSGNFKVKKFDLAGNYIEDFTAVGVPQSIGIAWDDMDNLYVSSFNQKHVRKFDSNGNDLGLFIDSNLVGPTNIWFDVNGDFLVSDYSDGAIKKFNNNGDFLGVYISGLNQCEGIDTLPNGNLLIGNGGTASVKMYDSTGNYIEDIVLSGAGGLIRPNAIVVRSVVSTTIEEIEENVLEVFPNSGDVFNIRVNKDLHAGATCLILNLSGKIVEEFILREEQKYNASHLAEGAYILLIKTDKIVYKTRITILH